MRILSGIQPSGTLHIGNYFGMMRPVIELQDQGDSYIFIASYHALSSDPDPDLIRQRIQNVALDFLACGLDPAKTVFFRQQDVPEVTELTWILSCHTPMGLLERCVSYKDKVSQGLSANHGLFAYPVLQAADILIYKSNLVPVGRDQKQHLEVTRDIAVRFNNRFGELLVIPEASIRDDVAVVPGVDGRKMSKSYDNTIEIFGKEKALRKSIMRVITDSTPMEEPKNPDACNVFTLFKLFGSAEEIESLRERYLAGGMGYGHAKQELFDKFWEYFRPMRARREELEQNLDHVESIMRQGGEKARALACRTMDEVRHAVGLR